MGKSAAKIRRNQARAAARGETYTPPPPKPLKEEASHVQDEDEDEDTIQRKSSAAQKLLQKLSDLENNPDNLNSKDRRTAKRKAEAIAAEEAGCTVESLLEWHKRFNKKLKNKTNNVAPTNQLSAEEEAKLTSAKKLKQSLDKLESDETINAKERRSAKRKAEAIATEETGCPSSELLTWYESITQDKNTHDPDKKHTTPYILFIGQLAYTTTPEMLFNHFQTNLGKDQITQDSLKIRLLTNNKNKSKGMAFIQLSSPELMYACLSLHLTHLDGRRINVERSSGGGAAVKKSRITQFREKQSTLLSETMDNIISFHINNGDIGQDELDEGVVGLCKRHSAAVVERALKEYVEEKRIRRERKEKLGEKEEEELRNPSAFLTHVIGRIAEEGVDGGGGKGGDGDRRRAGGSRGGKDRGSRSDSVLEKSGVDMSISYSSGKEGGSNIAGMFPSMQRGRGRGRGRGYM